MLEDAGVAVVYGAQSTFGLLDIEERSVPDAGSGLAMLIQETICRIKTGSLTSVKADTAITVDGGAYKVRHTEKEGDGAVTRLILAEA